MNVSKQEPVAVDLVATTPKNSMNLPVAPNFPLGSRLIVFSYVQHKLTPKNPSLTGTKASKTCCIAPRDSRYSERDGRGWRFCGEMFVPHPGPAETAIPGATPCAPTLSACESLLNTFRHILSIKQKPDIYIYIYYIYIRPSFLLFIPPFICMSSFSPVLLTVILSCLSTLQVPRVDETLRGR